MFLQILCLGLALCSPQLIANKQTPDTMHDKRHMINHAVQNVNELIDAVLQELSETHTMYHASCKKAQEREVELKEQLLSLEKENVQMRTIQAELNMAHRDMQKLIKSKTILESKLAQLQQQAGREIRQARNELETFKASLETKTNNSAKIFW